MKRSPNYVLSVDANTESGARQLLDIRAAVRFLNLQSRLVGDPERVRVVTSPVFLKKTSKYAWKYYPNTRVRSWRREDADHLNVYVVRK